jgi:Outer membrane protein beta-barrel domain
MMQKFFNFFLFLFPLLVFSQETPNFSEIDSLYREDQFYVNITYNALNNKPKDVFQNSFSTGINIGFLRDFPINKKRTFAIAPGLGLSYNNYKENLLIDNLNGSLNYNTIPTGASYDKNKLSLYFIDFPIEFRWRTSTFDSHKFYRVYAGFKVSYLFLSQSRYIDSNQSFKVDNNSDLDRFHYGVYLSTGYNSVNIYGYYGLNNFFKNGIINGESIKLSTVNFGLIFYIL